MDAHPSTPFPYPIEPARPEDLPAVRELQNDAFRKTLKRLLGKVPPGQGEGDRLRNRPLRTRAHLLVIRDEQDAVQGAMLLQQAGTRAFVGPLALASHFQRPWVEGAAPALVRRIVDLAVELGCPVMDSVTFPQSVAHLSLYWEFGAPILQSPFLSKRVSSAKGPVSPSRDLSVSRLSGTPLDHQATWVESLYPITNQFYPGFDVSDDVRHAQNRGIGDTLILHRGQQAIGFAVCHFGDGSEAFHDAQLMIKSLYVSPAFDQPQAAFHALMQGIEDLAVHLGLSMVSGMVSTGRRACVEALLARDFRVQEMHQQWLWIGDRPSSQVAKEGIRHFREDQFAMAEWR